MALIELNPRVASKIEDAKIAQKAKESKKAAKKSSNALLDIINEIRKDVDENLGEFKDQYQIIQDLNEFKHFIDESNKFGYIAIDTETMGLNPITDRIVGLCLYTPNQKPAYVPINHTDYITGERYNDQLTEKQIKPILDNLTAKIIMFNAAFDIRVIRHSIGTFLTCWWDTSLAAKCLNENEPKNQLKALHEKYILRSKNNSKTFKDFFSTISYDRVPMDCAYLYAAHDAIITYELYEFQHKYLNENARPDLRDVYNVFMNIEMPVVDIVCNMEDTGVMLDLEYARELSKKYHKIADEKLNFCYSEIEQYQNEIEQYKRANPNSKLSDPINMDSPTQLAILLYDIIGERSRDRKNPRGTGEDILLKINNSFTQALLDYRSAQKLLRTYIDKLPEIVEDDGRVHCRFHQYGTVTSRFSSTNPNMQNIPSKNDEIRKMFIGGTYERDVEQENGVYTFKKSEELETQEGWKFVELLRIGDVVEEQEVVDIKIEPDLTGKVYIEFK